MSSGDLFGRCIVAFVAGTDAVRTNSALEALLCATDPICQLAIFGTVNEELARDAEHARCLDMHPAAAGPVDIARALLAVDPDADLAIVTVDAELPSRWRLSLQRALHSDKGFATASPLCDTSLASSGSRGDGDSTQDLAARLGSTLAPRSIPAPRPLAGCVMIRAEARAAVADADPADWAGALSRLGWQHVVDASVAVRLPATTLAQNTVLTRERQDTYQSSLPQLRGGPARARSRAEIDNAHSRPLQLHIAHSWGGGLGRWVEDYCSADDTRRNLVLRSVGTRGAYGQRLTLQRGYEDPEPLRVWDLELPVHATAIRHSQYRTILREIVADFGVQAVLVSSLIGHSLEPLRTGLPTALITHDYYPLCVTIFGYFDSICERCDASRLASCIDANPMHAYFRGVNAADFDALRNMFIRDSLEQGVLLVSPSLSAADRWRRLAPQLAGARSEIVAHGVSLPPPLMFTPPTQGRLSIVMLNRIVPEKGSALLEALLPKLSKFADVTLLGCGIEGEAFARHPGVRIVKHYTREELPALVAQAAPHLGMLLSVYAETFCYALSELWQLGVPVLACRTGSLAERINDGIDGWLCNPDPSALLARLYAIDADRDRLSAMRTTLLARDLRGTREMVADYHKLLPVDPWYRPEPVAQVLADSEEESARARRVRLGVLTVSAHATYAAALRAFLRFTVVKLLGSPRVPRIVKRLISFAYPPVPGDDSRV